MRKHRKHYFDENQLIDIIQETLFNWVGFIVLHFKQHLGNYQFIAQNRHKIIFFYYFSRSISDNRIVVFLFEPIIKDYERNHPK